MCFSFTHSCAVHPQYDGPSYWVVGIQIPTFVVTFTMSNEKSETTFILQKAPYFNIKVVSEFQVDIVKMPNLHKP